jgi:uncharacterized membrane protein YgcG
MTTRLTMTMVSLGLGCALVATAGCGSSQPSSGLWSCFDTGSQIGCTRVSALSTTDQDINGDGVPDHFVCADDDDDGHDRDRDHDQSGALSLSGSDADHDGVDDALDCDHRDECESLSNDANPERHAGEGEAEHDGGEDDGGHHGGDGNGGSSGGGSSGGDSSGGAEMHDALACKAPKLTP